MGLLGPVCSPGRSYKQDHALMWHSGMETISFSRQQTPRRGGLSETLWEGHLGGFKVPELQDEDLATYIMPTQEGIRIGAGDNAAVASDDDIIR